MSKIQNKCTKYVKNHLIKALHKQTYENVDVDNLQMQ